MLDKILFASAVESAMGTMTSLFELIMKYESNGIDVIPIKDIKDIMYKNIHSSLSEKSMATQIAKETIKEQNNDRI